MPFSKLGVVLTVVVAALHAGAMKKPISAWSRRRKKRYIATIVVCQSSKLAQQRMYLCVERQQHMCNTTMQADASHSCDM
jgi:hypothetical protein